MPDPSAVHVTDLLADDGTHASAFAPCGAHWLIDCHGVPASSLTDALALETLLRDAACAAGAHVLSSHFHRFGHATEAGVTGVVLLAESHVTIHTWPEHGFAAIDLFLCGATYPDRALACIERGLHPARMLTTRNVRGEHRAGRFT